MMKKSVLYILPLLLLCSCAVSDRAMRMSGGVFGEYSAPRSYRIRSKKYQAKSRVLSSDRKLSNTGVSGLNDTLINIWPFFFSSNNYWCALWPMIDKDPYGFAVRPFFNKEGDDCSILFPLAAWNTADRSGWVANFFWEKHGFGFFPLMEQSRTQSKSSYYYTPLFFLNKYHKLLSPETMSRKEYSFFCALAYGEKENFIDHAASPYGWIYNKSDVDSEFRNEWSFRLRNHKERHPMPQNKKELDGLKKQLFSSLCRGQSKTVGFFPLFHSTRNTLDEYKFVVGPLLAGAKKNRNSYDWHILGGLAVSFKQSVSPDAFPPQRHLTVFKETTTCTIPCLFTRYKSQLKYSGQRYRLFEKFKEKSFDEPFSEALPRLKNILKEISPGTVMPPEIRDWNTFYLFKAELAAKENFSTEEHRSLFAGPFFYFKSTPKDNSWIIPALLSWGSRNQLKKEFTSLPLMTFIKESNTKGYTAVLAPLLYWNNFEYKDAVNKPIHSHSCKWSGEYNAVQEINQYAALGLFYRGKHAFNVAKKGVDHKKAEFVRKNLLALGNTYPYWKRKAEAIHRKQLDAEAWKPENKIEYYKKLIRFEELKAEKDSLTKSRKESDNLRNKVIKSAKELGLALEVSDFETRSSSIKAAEKLLKHTTELRWKEDIGNGLFFRKEKFYNGDHHWHFCHILAGGSRQGNKESSHILHLLYRQRKEANRSETIFFPFISHIKDGENSRTSFLWRVFSFGRKNGKTGGHIFFIPFGEKI